MLGIPYPKMNVIDAFQLQEIAFFGDRPGFHGWNRYCHRVPPFCLQWFIREA
jgi:hypothetical protein